MQITVAIDAMGGDHGPKVIIPAALKALELNQELHIILVGLSSAIEAELKNLQQTNIARLSIHHASELVGMDEQPQSALKNKKDSSMRVAIDLVKDGVASACVSAGNTGALMATARFVLKTLPGIDRPAIAGVFPCQKGKIYILDLGANADCTAEQLLQFAVMGSMLVSCVENRENPTVGLLNIGTEDIKGNEVVKKTGELLKASHLNFYGNIEGNVTLKAAEGLIQMIGRFLSQEFKRNWLTKIAGLAAAPVLKAFKKRMDPRNYNGASLLGLRGIVVKSHGGADTKAFLNAIHTALEESRSGVLDRITQQMEVEHLLLKQALASNADATGSENE
jgi:glycerol-3-phosphate acyltransferase PlsX